MQKEEQRRSGSPALRMPSASQRSKVHLSQSAVSMFVTHVRNDTTRSRTGDGRRRSLPNIKLSENAPGGDPPPPLEKVEVAQEDHESEGGISDVSDSDAAPSEVGSPGSDPQSSGAPKAEENRPLLSKLSCGGITRMFGSSQIVLFFDWDDTLFPTSWLESVAENPAAPRKDKFLYERLDQLKTVVTGLIEKACALSSVAIVTLSQAPWVSTSMQTFLPTLGETLSKHGIGVFYARDAGLSNTTSEPAGWGGSSPKGNRQRSNTSHLVELDAVFCKALGELGHTRENHGLVQTISIGSSLIEHRALQELQHSWTSTNQGVSFNVKTIKLMDDPNIEELIAQLSILTVSLDRLVQVNDDFDIEFGVSDGAIKLLKVQPQDAQRGKPESGSKLS